MSRIFHRWNHLHLVSRGGNRIRYSFTFREMLNGVTGMPMMKNVWRKSVVSPKIGNIFKKFPVFGETLLYLQQ